MPEIDNNKYFVGIHFRGSDKSYYFSTEFTDLKIGDLVVVYTVSGYEIGIISTPVMNQNTYKSTLELKPIVRKPTESDMMNYNFNIQEEKKALETTKKEIAKLGLAMDLIDAVYTLDGSKITITYTSPEKRVDFRELLHNIAPLLRCRVELRQIAARDKAKIIGGIGICGLPLCCSTFLNEFEGISIQRAKNQMLTLNIPKLSGQCGKLICCLLYEDDAYTEAKKEFPRFGTVVHTENGDYTVDGMNILSKTVRLVNTNRDDFITYELSDVLAMLNGTYKKKEKPLEKADDILPTFNIPGLEIPTEKHVQQGGKGQKDNQQRRDNNQRGGQQGRQGQPQGRGNGQPQNRRNNQRRDNNQRGGQPQQNRAQQQSRGQQSQQQGSAPQNNNQHRHHNNHRHHHNNNGQGGQGKGGNN